MRLHGAERGLRSAVLVAGLALVACANVDRGPIDECQDDVDCGVGSVCSLAQGNRCVPEELPPQAAIGFEIRESELRIELTGCDPEVTRELGGSELRVQKRSDMVRDYDVRATTRRSVVNCGGNECAGVCDEQALTCSEPNAAGLGLSMASRLGLSEFSVKENYEIDEPPPEGELPAPAEFTWPTYESADPRARSALILDVTPAADTSLSSFRRVLADDAPDEVDAVGLLRCQRGLFGNEDAVRTLAGAPIGGATVEFRYADAIAAPSSVIGTAPSCTDGDEDDECPPGWACNVSEGTCGLDLTDAPAGSSISTDELGGGFLPAWVYTYCEGMLAPVEPMYREFTVTVTPPTETGLPALVYSLNQGFIDPATGSSLRQVEIEGQLCLPDWLPPQPVKFSLAGEPVALTETSLGTYACCSTDCLPSTEPGVEPTPPPTVESCSQFSRVRFETRWFVPDVTQWAIAGCVPTSTYPDGSNGRFRTDVASCEGECSVGLTPGSAEDVNRTYGVAITQPVGSVFQSRRVSVQITPNTTELPSFELLPRVLLRGSIECATGNCIATNAVIAAERLRVETDEADLPGPFYFEARVDQAGAFVLPLDPGVYVITAYPAVGQPGAPSRFSVVDLRDGSELIEMIDGVPNATLGKPLLLDDGVLVRVALDDFEVSTGVAPLDVGSWKAQDDFPSDLYDLNDPQTCYGTDASGKASRRGCTIRRLRPTDATIPLLTSKRVQFTARSRGGDCG